MKPAATGRWRRVRDGGVEYFELTPAPSITVRFYTRRGGASGPPFDSLNLSYDVGDRVDCVEENTRLVRRAAGLPALVTVRQVHSDGVVVVDHTSLPPPTTEGDALITAEPGVGLGIRAADCLSVYLYSRDGSCTGIAHCGWRGTIAHTARKTVDAMVDRFSVPASDIRFCLGPCICAGCYDVGEDVRRQFASAFPEPARFFNRRVSDDGRPTSGLDLRAANRWLLTDAGLDEDEPLEVCSLETPDLFYSARRSRTTGRNLALIAIRA